MLMSCRPLRSGRVSTGQCTCFHYVVETRTLACGRQLLLDKLQFVGPT